METLTAPTRIEAKEGAQRSLRAYAALAQKNQKIHLTSDPFAAKAKGEIAREMAALYSREIRGNREIMDMPIALAAVDNTDTNIGTLSGTITAQRSLEFFRLQFPLLSRVYSDFSDQPAQFKQTEATRIVVTPALATYDATADASGRPKGWTITTPAKTKDVLITLDEHIGVPIVFDSNQLAATTRRLFDEQAPAASYTIAKHFVEKLYALMTPANFNAYAVVNGALVPIAYPNYVVGLGQFSRTSLAKIAAIFNPNEVPTENRSVLLNSTFYEQLSVDPSLVTFFAGQRAPEIITDSELPKMAKFLPVEAPNLANNNATPNLAGFAMHRAAIVAKTRLSNDYTQAMPGASYGSIITVTDPELGISVSLVQYTNHTGGYAEWRMQLMIGAAVGDTRGGLCILSQ